MKMSPLVRSIVTVVLKVFFASISMTAQQTPSLNDTTTWLQNAVGNHGWDNDRAPLLGLKTTSSLEITGCAAKLTLVLVGHNVVDQDISHKEVYDFELGEFDPTRVDVSHRGGVWENDGFVGVETVNSKKSVKKTLIYDGSPRVEATNNIWFEFDSIDMSDRFQRALKHAVELCGGKSSIF